MGTSNLFRGPGAVTPLVPTWLDGNGSQSPTNNNSDNNVSGDKEDNFEPNGNLIPAAPAVRPKIRPGPDRRFTAARTNFTQFIRSGGKDGSKLAKSVSSYISKSNKGSRNASKRIGSSRRATANLLNFFSSVQSKGSSEALRELNLQGLIGKPVEEVFLGLTEYICPEGGNIDEGIARNAFIETITELAENGITDMDTLTPEQMRTVLEVFATHAIEGRLCNDIGTKICIGSENINEFEKIQAQLHEFIMRGVTDAFDQANINIKSMIPEKAQTIIDSIYESAFSILQTIADGEADDK